VAGMGAAGCAESSSVFVVLDRDLRISLVELPENKEAISALVTETKIFGDWVDNGISSANDELLDYFSASDIARIYTLKEESVDLPTEAAEWLLQLEEGRALQKQGEGLETKAKDVLTRMMLGCEIGFLNGQQVITWRQQAGRKSLDTKRLKEDYPELCAQYEREGAPFRVMKTTKAKKESR